MPRNITRLFSVLAVVVVVTCAGRTQVTATPASHDEGPIGAAALAVRVVAREVPLVAAPDAKAAHRGTLRQSALATVYARHRSNGCKNEWFLLGPATWACNSPGLFELHDVRVQRTFEEQDDVEFARIGANGAIGYRSMDRAEQQLPDAELQPGFFVGLLEERSIHGDVYARTTHDVWIARRDLVALRPSSFQGVELESAAADQTLLASSVRPASGVPVVSEQGHLPYLPLGWIFVEQAIPRRGVAGPAQLGPRLPRLTRMRVLEVRQHHDHHVWYRVDAGWLSDQQLRVPTAALPPVGLVANERWLDIDKRTQTLVAYVGPTPVFATLVSTGRGPDGSPTATPSGVFRIWVKLTSTDMDNLDEQQSPSDATLAPQPYAVEAVPFVMFFLRGYGLHATYWHDAFGSPRSHGCVNLSLRDAAWLFEFAGPRLPPGWQAVHPYAHDPGTLVRVR